MAFGLRYTSSFDDYEVQIRKKNYSGEVTAIDKLAPSPIEINYSSKDKERISQVQGSSLMFTFYESTSTDDNYDELFNSDYLDYKLLFINSDTSTLIWEGYIKPENLSKSFLDYNKLIRLEATDAIADLKDIPYTHVSGRISILSAIKTALSPLGIELPFHIQLNTWETTYMNQGECPLEKAYIDTRKFYDNKNGKIEYDDSYSVIERLLQPFNCQLKQENGAYQIVNFNEVDSSVFIYDWSTLSNQSVTNSNNVVDISSYSFHTTSDLTKIRPLKTVDLIFSNKDIGGELVADISSWDNSSVWRIGGPWSVEGENVLKIINETPAFDCSIALVSPFAVNYISGNEYMKLSLDMMIDPIPGYPPATDGDAIYLQVWLKESGGIWTRAADWFVTRSIFYQNYTSIASGTWKIPNDTTYEMYLVITAPESFNNMNIRIKNLSLTQVNYVDGEITDAVVFDKNFVGDIGINKDKFADKIYFGDSDAITEISAITIGGLNLSKSWRLYGESTSGQLQKLYAKTILKNNQRFRDYIKLEVIDKENSISSNSIIKFDSDKKYIITDFYRNYAREYVRLSLSELITDEPATFSFSQTYLTSVNGQSTESTSNIVPPASGDHGNLTGLSDNDHPQYLLKTDHIKLPVYNDSSVMLYYEASTNSIRVNANLFAEGDVVSYANLANVPDIWEALRYVREASLGNTLYWSAGKLEASGTGGGSVVNSSTWSISGNDIYYNKGGVAIGSASPSGRTLHVTGNMTVTQGAIINDIKVNRSTGGANYPSYPDIYATTGGIVIGGLSNGTGTVSFATTGSATLPSMHITTAGNVGIGTKTPLVSMHVVSPARSATPPTSGSPSGIALAVSSVDGNYGTTFGSQSTGDGFIQQMRIDGQSGTYNLMLQPTGGNVGIGTTTPANYSNYVVLQLGDNNATKTGLLKLSSTYNAGNGAEIFQTPDGLLRINTNGGTNAIACLPSGNVGIGTFSPWVKFQVKPAINTMQFAIEQNNATAGTYMWSDSGTGDFIIGRYSSAGDNKAEQLRITNSGNNVIISNISATDHTASLGFNGWTGLAGPLAQITALMTGNGSFLKFYTSNNYAAGSNIEGMSLDYNGNLNVKGEVTAYYSSDASLKSDIKPFTALDIIHQLQPKTFKWNDKAKELNDKKDDRNNFGLIAQEVEKVLPELIHTIYDEYKSVDYVQLIPILIQAIKEQQKQINRLEQDLNFYKNSNY